MHRYPIIGNNYLNICVSNIINKIVLGVLEINNILSKVKNSVILITVMSL